MRPHFIVPTSIIHTVTAHFTVIGAKAVSAALITHRSSRRMKWNGEPLTVPSLRQGVAEPCVFYFAGETDRKYYVFERESCLRHSLRYKLKVPRFIQDSAPWGSFPCKYT